MHVTCALPPENQSLYKHVRKTETRPLCWLQQIQQQCNGRFHYPKLPSEENNFKFSSCCNRHNTGRSKMDLSTVLVYLTTDDLDNLSVKDIL